MSNTKDFDRYYSPAIETLVQELKEARERRTAVVNEFQFRVRLQSILSLAQTDARVTRRFTLSSTRIIRRGCKRSNSLPNSIVCSVWRRRQSRLGNRPFDLRLSNRMQRLSSLKACDILVYSGMYFTVVSGKNSDGRLTSPRKLFFILSSATIDFIPNDVKLGGEAEQMVLLTGPNVRRSSSGTAHCTLLTPNHA